MNRKNFFQSLAALGGATLLSNRVFSADETNKLKGQIKITDVKPYVFDKATFVKIETDAGISGWGEADHDYPKLVAAVIDDACKKFVVGRDPFDTEFIWNQLYFQLEDIGFSGLLPGTIAGIDNALWDLKGKLLNLPVHKISGGSNIDKVRVYGSFGRGSGKSKKTADEMAKIAVEYVEQGYKTVKARMQIRQLNVDPDPDDTFNVIKTVRQAIGDEIELFVDFNNGYTPSKAIVLGLKLYEQLNVTAIEEPVSMQNYTGLRQVVDALPIPVMAGEHEFNKWQVKDLITIGNPDFINLDLIKSAGFTECRKSAAIAHVFDKYIMTHNTRPTLATAASLQLIASIPNAARVQEYAGQRIEMGLSVLFQNEIEFKDGHLIVPTIPGLGLIVNESQMEKNKLNK